MTMYWENGKGYFREIPHKPGTYPKPMIYKFGKRTGNAPKPSFPYWDKFAIHIRGFDSDRVELKGVDKSKLPRIYGRDKPMINAISGQFMPPSKLPEGDVTHKIVGAFALPRHYLPWRRLRTVFSAVNGNYYDRSKFYFDKIHFNEKAPEVWIHDFPTYTWSTVLDELKKEREIKHIRILRLQDGRLGYTYVPKYERTLIEEAPESISKYFWKPKKLPVVTKVAVSYKVPVTSKGTMYNKSLVKKASDATRESAKSAILRTKLSELVMNRLEKTRFSKAADLSWETLPVLTRFSAMIRASSERGDGVFVGTWNEGSKQRPRSSATIGKKSIHHRTERRALAEGVLKPRHISPGDPIVQWATSLTPAPRSKVKARLEASGSSRWQLDAGRNWQDSSWWAERGYGITNFKKQEPRFIDGARNPKYQEKDVIPYFDKKTNSIPFKVHFPDNELNVLKLGGLVRTPKIWLKSKTPRIPKGEFRKLDYLERRSLGFSDRRFWKGYNMLRSGMGLVFRTDSRSVGSTYESSWRGKTEAKVRRIGLITTTEHWDLYEMKSVWTDNYLPARIKGAFRYNRLRRKRFGQRPVFAHPGASGDMVEIAQGHKFSHLSSIYLSLYPWRRITQLKRIKEGASSLRSSRWNKLTSGAAREKFSNFNYSSIRGVRVIGRQYFLTKGGVDTSSWFVGFGRDTFIQGRFESAGSEILPFISQTEWHTGGAFRNRKGHTAVELENPVKGRRSRYDSWTHVGHHVLNPYGGYITSDLNRAVKVSEILLRLNASLDHRLSGLPLLNNIYGLELSKGISSADRKRLHGLCHVSPILNSHKQFFLERARDVKFETAQVSEHGWFYKTRMQGIPSSASEGVGALEIMQGGGAQVGAYNGMGYLGSYGQNLVSGEDRIAPYHGGHTIPMLIPEVADLSQMDGIDLNPVRLESGVVRCDWVDPIDALLKYQLSVLDGSMVGVRLDGNLVFVSGIITVRDAWLHVKRHALRSGADDVEDKRIAHEGVSGCCTMWSSCICSIESSSMGGRLVVGCKTKLRDGMVVNMYTGGGAIGRTRLLSYLVDTLIADASVWSSLDTARNGVDNILINTFTNLCDHVRSRVNEYGSISQTSGVGSGLDLNEHDSTISYLSVVGGSSRDPRFEQGKFSRKGYNGRQEEAKEVNVVMDSKKLTCVKVATRFGVKGTGIDRARITEVMKQSIVASNSSRAIEVGRYRGKMLDAGVGRVVPIPALVLLDKMDDPDRALISVNNNNTNKLRSLLSTYCLKNHNNIEFTRNPPGRWPVKEALDLRRYTGKSPYAPVLGGIVGSTRKSLYTDDTFDYRSLLPTRDFLTDILPTFNTTQKVHYVEADFLDEAYELLDTRTILVYHAKQAERSHTHWLAYRKSPYEYTNMLSYRLGMSVQPEDLQPIVDWNLRCVKSEWRKKGCLRPLCMSKFGGTYSRHLSTVDKVLFKSAGLDLKIADWFTYVDTLSWRLFVLQDTDLGVLLRRFELWKAVGPVMDIHIGPGKELDNSLYRVGERAEMEELTVVLAKIGSQFQYLPSAPASTEGSGLVLRPVDKPPTAVYGPAYPSTDSAGYRIADEYEKRHVPEKPLLDSRWNWLKDREVLSVEDQIPTYESHRKPLLDTPPQMAAGNPVLFNLDHFEFYEVETLSKSAKHIKSYLPGNLLETWKEEVTKNVVIHQIPLFYAVRCEGWISPDYEAWSKVSHVQLAVKASHGDHRESALGYRNGPVRAPFDVYQNLESKCQKSSDLIKKFEVKLSKIRSVNMDKIKIENAYAS